MGKYLFIANGRNVIQDDDDTNIDFMCSNYFRIPVEIANEMEYKSIIGINNKKATSIKYSEDIEFYNANIYRNIFDVKNNIMAYINMMRILKNEDIDVIHCNTPLGGVLGRVCGKKAKVKKIIYTAHGFHFYKGAPLLNGTLFKWIEIWLARYTDAIITINEEDYQAAQHFKLRNQGKVYYLPGVGINIESYNNIQSNKSELIKEIQVDDSSILMISIGDLNKNKNNRVIIKALGKLQNRNIHYLLCGEGDKKKNLLELARGYNMENNIHFLGYRNDIARLLKSCDIFIMPSYREGLSRSLMEAMSSGLPCIASNIRGNIDLIDEGEGGYLFSPEDYLGYSKAIKTLIENPTLRKRMGMYNKNKIQYYEEKNVKMELKKIYSEVLNNNLTE